MNNEEILLRSIRGSSYLSIAPCILLSAAVWFTPDSSGIVIANIFQIYFSLLLFYLFGKIWSLRSNFEQPLRSELKKIAIIPALLAMIGIILTLYMNPAWGIAFLMVGFYLFRFIRFYFLIFQTISHTYIDLFNRISIILCICLMLILTYWLNPYSNPIEAYI